ncbi:MAG TPA: hypothetical protein VMV24_02180 [Candidatus Dormibacteraeota bacterium]|nr:hypothetical protein [Candidatus Dormibacteraeota bacterium]
MNNFESKITVEEFFLNDEITEILTQHADKIYKMPGAPLLDIPDKELLFGVIENPVGPNTQVILEIERFRNNETITMLSINDHEYLISAFGVIFVGDPEEIEEMEIEEAAMYLRFWVSETVWSAIDSGSPV